MKVRAGTEMAIKEVRTTIIQTKYRDIPWEEARKCAGTDNQTRENEAFWEAVRGQTVYIETPATHGRYAPIRGCSGPWYTVDKIRSLQMGQCVCPHLAEIGD